MLLPTSFNLLGQLLEAQQTAKQCRNEQAHLMDKIIALTAELESKNVSDDNKIREKLFEKQHECNKLQNTLTALQSEFMRYFALNLFF